jgi:hypothetical protein
MVNRILSRTVWPIGLLVAGLVVEASLLGVGIDDLDEGYFTEQARRVLHGQVPYRDFETLYTPGLAYLHAGIFALQAGAPGLLGTLPTVLAGPSESPLFGPRLLAWMARGALVLVLFAMTRPLVRNPWWAMLPGLILLLGLDDAPERWEPHPGWLSSLFAVVAVWCLARMQPRCERLHPPPSTLEYDGGGITGRVKSGITQNVTGPPTGPSGVTRRFTGLLTAASSVTQRLAAALMRTPSVTQHPTAASDDTQRRAAASSITQGPPAESGVTHHRAAASSVTERPTAESGVAHHRSAASSVTQRPTTESGATHHRAAESSVTQRPTATSGVAHHRVTVSGVTQRLAAALSRSTSTSPSTAEPDSSLWLVATGLAAAGAYLFKQNTGLFILGAIVVWCFWSGWRWYLPLGAFAVATLVWLVPLVIALHGDVSSLGVIIGAVSQAGLLSAPEPTLLIPLAAIVGGLWLVRRDSHPHLRLYLLTGLALMLTEFPRMDTLHLIWATPLLLVVGAIALERVPRALAISCLAVTGVLLWPTLSARLTLVSLPRAQVDGVWAPAQTAADLQPTLDDIRQRSRPGEPIFVYPSSPLLYALADRPNPTRFDHLNPGAASPRQIQQVIADLERANPRVVVISDFWESAWGDPGDNAALESWIDAHYAEVARHGAYRVLVPDL